MVYADKEIVCADCGSTFVFSSGEQEFYAGRGLTNEPRRCRDCRSSRKEQRGGVSSRPREMYPAVCANCGTETEVPFRPTGVRPVYCNDCFSKVRN
ncbi:MAG: zinc-ribbon domain containing protein [Chloroflexi bacterium]|nr:zinc-ribbon domain containing protein [Chloroflexota bacterium]